MPDLFGTPSFWETFRQTRPRVYAVAGYEPTGEGFDGLAFDEQAERVRHAFPAVDPRFVEQEAGQDQAVDLPGRGRLKLAAFAVSIPGIHDSADRLLWRDPTSLKPIGGQQLLAPGLNHNANTLRSAPQLSLLFSAENGLPFACATEIHAFDARTDALLSFGTQSDGLQSHADTWTRIDLPIGVWHDTSVKIGLNVLCGEAEILSIGDSREAEGAGAGGFKIRIAPPTTIDIRQIDPVNQSLGEVIDQVPLAEVTTESVAHRDHFRLTAMRNGSTCVVNPGWTPGTRIDLIAVAVDENDQLGCVYFPNEVRAWFEIAGLPDMPNGPDLRNLFEARIPEITIGEGTLRKGLIYAICDATQLEESLGLTGTVINWDNFSISASDITAFMQPGTNSAVYGRIPPPSAIGSGPARPIVRIMPHEPESETFNDLRVFELLEILAERHEPHGYRVDQAMLRLESAAPPTRWSERLKGWWADHAPGWLQF